MIGTPTTASDTVGTGTVAPALPSGVAPGDVLVLGVTVKDSSSTTVTVTGSGTWTNQGTYHNGSTTNNTQVDVFTRTVQAGEAAPTISVNGGTAPVKSAILADYRGVDPTNPVDAKASTSAAGTSSSVLSVTPSTTGDEYVVFAGATGFTLPATWTPPASTVVEARQDNQVRVAAMLADQPWPTTSATGLRSVGLSQSGAIVTASLLLAPARVRYSYDAQGNRTGYTPVGGPTTTLGYDQANRLTSYGANATYAYNGDGLRTSKAVGPSNARTTTAFTWSADRGLPLLLQESVTGASTDLVDYVYGEGATPIEQIRAPLNITPVGTSTPAVDSTGTQNSLAITLPSGIAKGDLIVLTVGTQADDRITPPTGYTGIGAGNSSAGAGRWVGANNQLVGVFSKVATGSESGTSISVGFAPKSQTSTPAKTVLAAVYRNVDTGNMLDGTVQVGFAGAANTLTLPAATTTGDHDRLLAAFNALGGVPGTWTPRASEGLTVRTRSDNQLRIGTILADQQLNANGSTGSRTADYTMANGTADVVGVLIPLRPLPPPVLYYHQDQLGSTRAVTDPSGTIVATYNYSPYGRTISHSGVSVNLQDAGQYSDAETGYQYLRARHYDPSTGNFLSADPLQGTTRVAYGYAADDPLSYTDVTGLCAECGADRYGPAFSGALGVAGGAEVISVAGEVGVAAAELTAVPVFGLLLGAVVFGVGAVGLVVGAYLLYTASQSC